MARASRVAGARLPVVLGDADGVADAGNGVEPSMHDVVEAVVSGAPLDVAVGVAEDAVTIGVAIPVPAPHASDLQRWRADFGDPLAWAIPAHITLVPPTSVSRRQLDDVSVHLAAAAAEVAPFDLCLRGTGSFRPVSPVVFVQVSDGAAQCAQLEATVRSGLLDGRRRFSYHPHVTVAHGLDDDALDRAREALAEYEVGFGVSTLVLYRHHGDGVWRPVAEYALGGR